MTKSQSEGNSDLFTRKPSELPPYTPLHTHKRPVSHLSQEQDSQVNSYLESGVRVVRTEFQNAVNVVSEKTESVQNVFDTGKAHTLQAIDYLNEPQNILPRSGAIAIGGLSGLIFGARGGLFKKFFYTSVGAGTIASICYPRQAEHVARETLHEVRNLTAISYNFIKGVKPGDEVPFEPLKNFPTSVEDIKYLVMDFYDEVKANMFPTKK